MDTKDKSVVSEYMVLLLAFLGLIQFVGSVLNTALNFVVSLILLVISAFGVMWLWDIGKRKQFKSKDTIIAMALIVVGYLLFVTIPTLVPTSMSSLVMP
jgi:hypothetical protein